MSRCKLHTASIASLLELVRTSTSAASTACISMSSMRRSERHICEPSSPTQCVLEELRCASAQHSCICSDVIRRPLMLRPARATQGHRAKWSVRSACSADSHTRGRSASLPRGEWGTKKRQWWCEELCVFRSIRLSWGGGAHASSCTKRGQMAQARGDSDDSDRDMQGISSDEDEDDQDDDDKPLGAAPGPKGRRSATVGASTRLVLHSLFATSRPTRS